MMKNSNPIVQLRVLVTPGWRKVKQVIGAFLFNRQLLAWDSYKCQMTDSMSKDLKEMNVDSMIIPVRWTKYIQAPVLCWNKPFKVRMTKLHDQWLSEGTHQFTEGGNMKLPSRKRIIEWVLDAWWWHRGWLYPLFKKETALWSWKTKDELSAVNSQLSNWQKWCCKYIHFSL